MKIADLKKEDRFEDQRRGMIFVITRIAPCGSCQCGWGEISYEEVVPNSPSGHHHVGRKHCKTFKQFERLRFLRKVDDHGRPLERERRTPLTDPLDSK
jgi:hypothetical protein